MWCPPNTLLAVATDNKAAERWTRSGLAPSAYANRILTCLWRIATDKRLRIATAYIAGPRNITDRFSRTDDHCGPLLTTWVPPDTDFRMATYL